jgi:rhamnosyl/mannosyltransferase
MAEKIVVFSKEYADSSPVLRDFKGKIAVIPYGVDVNKFKKFDKSRVKELRAIGKPPFFLFVGRLVRYKGLHFLIKAMKNVNGTLFIVGNGPLLANLRSIANDRVHFFTKISDADLVNFYHACDVFVLPSTTRAEAFGIVQLEAMACAKPVISTRLNTGVDFVNKSGILVKPADVGALVNAMNSLQNKSLRSKVGKAGLERVKKYFSRAQMVKGLLDLYSS